jgi:cohesin complex subunit SA-1/2
MLESVFKGLIVHRYKDVDFRVRIVVLKQFGLWMLQAPDIYLDTVYTRHVGWLLSDQKATVRLHALTTLYEVYKDGENGERLASFGQVFGARLAEMANDVDDAVQAKSLLLLPFVASDLSPKALEDVEHCLFCKFVLMLEC